MATRMEGSQTGAAASSRQVFQAQLASIMEVLANAAVAEICKLVDNDHAVLSLQMSQCQRENKDLKRRLHELELKAAREHAEKRLSVVNGNGGRNNNNNNNNNNKTISSSCGSPPPVNVHSVSAGASHVTQVGVSLWQSSEASEDSDVEATHSRAPHRDAHEEQPQEPGAAILKEEMTHEGAEDDTDMEVALGLLKQEEEFPVHEHVQMEVNNDEQEESPTVHIALRNAKKKMLKEKILTLEGKVESLSEERTFLRERLEDALNRKAEVAEQQYFLDDPTRSSHYSNSNASDIEAEPVQKKKRGDWKKLKKPKDDFRRVRTPEESILRYNKVLELVKAGSTKTDAYFSMNVDRNTIVTQAPIAELAAVNPELFRALRSGFKKGDSLQKFTARCMEQCIVEPHVGLITVMKEANDLLDIGKK